MPKKKQDDGLSFDTMLARSVVDGKKSKKKDENPEIILTAALTKDLKTFIEKKKETKQAEADMRLAEQPLLAFCLKKMDEDGVGGDFHSSYNIKGKEPEDSEYTTAKFITADKFKLPEDDEGLEAIKDILGEHYDDSVETTTKVILKDTVFKDEKLKKELVEMFGVRFSEFFETQKTVKLKSGFDEKMYDIAENIEEAVKIREMCGKSKPFFK